MKLVVVIPALNEEATIADVVDRVPRDINGIVSVDVVVVDDGSNDRTAELARGRGAEVLSHPGNRGVGAAFHTGSQRALDLGADIMVNMDGDGQFNPEDIRSLVQPLLDGQADFVTASRFIDPTLYPEMSAIKFHGNRFMSRLISRLCGTRYYDVSCGFRAYTRDTLLRLNLFGAFTYTQEMFLDLSFKGVKILEVPVKIRGTREFGKSRVAGNLWRYGLHTAKIIFRSYRDYRPLRFFGTISAALFVIGLLLFGFFIGHYFIAGRFSPHIWAGMTAGTLGVFALLFFVAGILADMLARIRINQERMLYLLKKRPR